MDILKNLSIIIPNHNEVRVGEVESWCKRLFPSAEIIVENDLQGQGKGYTIRNAVKKSTKSWVAFMDADMDIFPMKLFKLLPHAQTHDIVIAKKETSHLSIPRRILTEGSRLLIKLFFRIPVSDTQTGLKLFKRDTISSWETNGYLFDVEILYKAHIAGRKIKEVPITNVLSTKSKGLKEIFKCLKELNILYVRLSSRL